MKNRLLKTFTSLVLVALMVLSVIPAFAITIGAKNVSATLTKVAISDIKDLELDQKYVITYDIYAMKAEVENGRLSNGSFAEGKPTIDDYCIWTISKNSEGYYTLYNEATKSYAAGTGARNKAKLMSTATDTKAQWTITLNNDYTFEIVNVANATAGVNKTLRNNGTYGFACYSTSTGGSLTLYKVTTETTECAHTNKEERSEVPATCTEAGHEAGTYCKDCKKYISGGAEIPSKGHQNTEDIAEVPATCKKVGHEAGTYCNDCKTYISGGAEIPKTAHSYDENGVCTKCDETIPKYTKVDLADITAADTVIIVATTKDGTSYAMSNGNGASAAPTAVSVKISNGAITTDATNILWNISKVGDNLTIYVNGTTETWLYCTDTNDGVRVGTNVNKVFTMDSGSGYLQHTATSRYLGVYTTKPDWRCYTSTGGNIAGQTFSFYKLVDANCTHDNTENIDEVAPTCTTPGKEAGTKCLDCGTIISGCEPIDATGHLHTEEVEAVDATCTTPGANAGVKCTDCGTIISGCETIDATGHKFVNGKCAYNCGATRAVYTKVDDISTLVAGDVIVIYYPSGKLLLSGTASGTKLEGVSATVSNNTVISNNDDELVLIVGKDENGYVYFQTKDGKYLTSTGSNNLTLEDTLTDNAKWYFDTTGKTATLRIVNQNANNQALEYYKGFFTVYTIGDTAAYNFEVYRKAEPVIEGVGLSLNKGITVNVRYTIPGSWLTENAGAKVVFSNGTEVVITEAGENVYSVTLTPAKINNDLTVKLVKEDGTVVIEEKDVSFAKYKELIGTGDEKLTALLNSIKTYADAADGTLQGELENTVESVEGSVTSTGALFNAYGAALKEQASIKLSVDTAKIAGDYRLTVTLGSKTVVENELLADYITAGNLIVINGLFPSNFDETINVTVSDGTTDVATLSFTFNTYLKDVYGTANSELKNLIVAAYNYGVAAEAYAGN